MPSLRFMSFGRPFIVVGRSVFNFAWSRLSRLETVEVRLDVQSAVRKRTIGLDNVCSLKNRILFNVYNDENLNNELVPIKSYF